MKKSKIIKKIIFRSLVLGVFLCCFSTLAFANVTSMYLSPAVSTVDLGGIFSIDAYLDNSTATIFDSVLMWLTFDPAVLEVQDSDPGTAGVQILSDPLSVYNFNYPVANIVNGGTIDFQQSYTGTSSSASGIFARINFKAIALTDSTPAAFNFNTWGFTPSSSVMYGGNDVLALSADHTDGTFGADVRVIPEPNSIFLFLLGLGMSGFLRAVVFKS